MNGDPIAELCEERVRLIEKYRLVPKKINKKLFWVRQFCNRPDHPYATHRAFMKCSTLQLVFSFYDLCVAKMTYFTRNIDDYDSCKFNYRSQELERCPVWDMEFLVQKGTGIPVDLRNLAAITDITVFREMCDWLQRQKERPALMLPPELFDREFSHFYNSSLQKIANTATLLSA